jgi:hypothetical protein
LIPSPSVNCVARITPESFPRSACAGVLFFLTKLNGLSLFFLDPFFFGCSIVFCFLVADFSGSHYGDCW